MGKDTPSKSSSARFSPASRKSWPAFTVKPHSMVNEAPPARKEVDNSPLNWYRDPPEYSDSSPAESRRLSLVNPSQPDNLSSRWLMRRSISPPVQALSRRLQEHMAGSPVYQPPSHPASPIYGPSSNGLSLYPDEGIQLRHLASPFASPPCRRLPLRTAFHDEPPSPSPVSRRRLAVLRSSCEVQQSSAPEPDVSYGRGGSQISVEESEGSAVSSGARSGSWGSYDDLGVSESEDQVEVVCGNGTMYVPVTVFAGNR
jgi:hypothetical protein